MNNVSLVGRSTRDVELRHTQSGQTLASFTIAVDKGLSKAKKKEFEEQGKPTADFINTVVWGNSAEYVAKYLKKGKLVAVQGRINTGRYEDKEGRTVYRTDINAYNVQVLEYDNTESTGSSDVSGFSETADENIPF